MDSPVGWSIPLTGSPREGPSTTPVNVNKVVNVFLCHIDVCNVEQLLCNVGLDILSTLFLIMIGYDLMCTFYILVRY